jgi:hypothetical protein
MEVGCSWTVATSISSCVCRAATAEMQGADFYCVWVHICAKVEVCFSYGSLPTWYANLLHRSIEGMLSTSNKSESGELSMHDHISLDLKSSHVGCVARFVELWCMWLMTCDIGTYKRREQEERVGGKEQWAKGSMSGWLF